MLFFKRKEKSLSPDIKRYAKIIFMSPVRNKIRVWNFGTKEKAEVKRIKLKGWSYQAIVKARDENGRFKKGWVLICCK